MLQNLGHSSLFLFVGVALIVRNTYRIMFCLYCWAMIEVNSVANTKNIYIYNKVHWNEKTVVENLVTVFLQTRLKWKKTHFFNNRSRTYVDCLEKETIETK